MKALVFYLFVIALLTQAVEARLGETLDQCVQRYGPLIRKQGRADNPQFMFEKDGITIGINFLDGKAAQVSYSRASGSPFLDLEVRQLLEVNSAGSTWQYDQAESNRLRTTAYSKRECFRRGDGGAFAEHLVVAQIGTHFVTVTSSDYKKAIGARQLEGF
jgi:hypothetical protein